MSLPNPDTYRQSARKDVNPKDAVGVTKTPASCFPQNVAAEAAVAMLEGALKYGRHNYRVAGVRASVSYDAARRHLDDWWEGEDLDPDSQLSHVSKAIAALTVLRDGMIRENWVDDRPPKSPRGWMAKLNERVKALLEKYPEDVRKEPFTELGAVAKASATLTEDDIARAEYAQDEASVTGAPPLTWVEVAHQPGTYECNICDRTHKVGAGCAYTGGAMT